LKSPALEQPHENVLDVLAHVARFGQRGGVGDRERHVQDAREGLREQRLPHAGWADEEMFDLSSSTSSSRTDAELILL